MASRLGLSKALVSPALDELCRYKLIREVAGSNEKVKNYEATENISEVIQHVLKNREAKMLKRITEDYRKLHKAGSKSGKLNIERVSSLGEMIAAANVMLEMMSSQEDIMQLPNQFE